MKQLQAKEFGIEPKQEKELLANLPQITKERDALEMQYDEIIKMDIESPDTWKKARELRLLIRTNRTQGINVWHRNAKDFFLKGGQFVDAIKRKEIAINERMEDALLQIEKHEEILKQREIERLNSLRSEEIEIYKDFIPFGINLGEMEEDDYKKLFNGAKMQYDAEQERIRKENERLEKERIERERLEKEKFEKIEEERKRERERAKKIQEEIERQAEKERKERERLEKAIKEEKERKDKEERERLLAAERAKKAPIKEQMNNWINSLEIPNIDIDNEVKTDIINKFNSFKEWAKKQIEQL